MAFFDRFENKQLAFVSTAVAILVDIRVRWRTNRRCIARNAPHLSTCDEKEIKTRHVKNKTPDTRREDTEHQLHYTTRGAGVVHVGQRRPSPTVSAAIVLGIPPTYTHDTQPIEVNQLDEEQGHHHHHHHHTCIFNAIIHQHKKETLNTQTRAFD